MIAAWGSSRRIVAPDLLGHGGSEAPVDPTAHALERQAAGIRDLLMLLDAAPADVVGYSMGARLAMVLALGHPETVRRLILESPSAGITDASERAARREADEARARRLEDDGIEAFVDGWEAEPLFASQASLPASVRAEIRADRLRHDPRALAASLRGAGQGAMRPLANELPGLDRPVLVIAGALDEAGSARAVSVSEAIPGARLELVEGSGHNVHTEAPEAFERLVSSFLIEQPATTHQTH